GATRDRLPRSAARPRRRSPTRRASGPGTSGRGAGTASAPLPGDDRALLGVHLVPDAGALAEVPHARRGAFREELLVGLRRDVRRRLPVSDLHLEQPLDEVDVVHADRVVVGEERAHLDADVAADALLEAVLDGLLAPTGERAGRQVLDALHRAELRALPAR